MSILFQSKRSLCRKKLTIPVSCCERKILGLGRLEKQLPLQRGLLSDHSYCDYKLRTSAVRGVDLSNGIVSNPKAILQQGLSQSLRECWESNSAFHKKSKCLQGFWEKTIHYDPYGYHTLGIYYIEGCQCQHSVLSLPVLSIFLWV